MINVGINGFGRIGKLVFYAIENRRLSGENICVTAINNSPIDLKYLKYLIEHDSVHRPPEYKINIDKDRFFVNDREIAVFQEREPEKINWDTANVDIVVEATGVFTKKEDANRHLLNNNVQKVVITAPSPDAPMYVMGVNHREYQGENIISNASCTTNGLGPLVKVIHDNFEITEGLMSTIHSSTASQRIVDGTSKKDWRAGRAAGLNIIPSSTGAAKAIGKILPELNGKITGIAYRVPVYDVSVIDFTFKVKRETSYEEIVKTIKDASNNELCGIIGYTDDKVVSSDFIGNTHSTILDIDAGTSIDNSMFKIVSWYDNEWGYSNRVVDLINIIL
jgi:glyceraldehyde 3-phosphate dehydrogenase